MSFKRGLIAIIAATALLLSGCGNKNAEEQQVPLESTYVTEALDTSDMFSDRDTDASYDAVAASSITLQNETVKIAGAGTYIVSGSISDGQIIVEANSTDKIQLVFNGVDISSSSSAAVYVKQADKVFITLAENSINKLANTVGFTADGDTNVDGVIFSKDDLTINGSGSLEITSADHGIVSKDDLVIAAGSYKIDAASHAISGKDSVRICGGEFNISAGKDGLHAENTEDTALGFIYVSSGDFTVSCDGDGMDASGKLQLDGGSYSITAAGGAANASGTQGSDNMMRPGYSSTAQSDAVSCKGIKSNSAVIIVGGEYSIDSADDAVHSNASLEVGGGIFEISSGDDGFHADEALFISDGRINIRQSYEGLEGLTIDIAGGEIELIASDDGLNAAGGNDQSGFGGPGGGMLPDAFGTSSDSWIKILGGKLKIDAGGDGVDSNGALYVSGGETYVSGPTNSGNGALDYGTVAEISGGIFVAVGASGMSENFTSGSTQGAIMITAQGGAGVTVTLKNSDGESLINFAPEKTYSSVVLSCPEIVKGEKYTVTVGSYSYEVEMDEIIYSLGGMGGMNAPGGMGGGGMPARP